MPSLEEMWPDLLDGDIGLSVGPVVQRQHVQHVKTARQSGRGSHVPEQRLSPQKIEEATTGLAGSPVRRFDDPTPASQAEDSEQAELVQMLASFQMIGYYRTLAEQGLDTLEMLCQASRDGLLFKKLRQACVPDQVRDTLYGVVQTHLLREWHGRHHKSKSAPKAHSTKRKGGVLNSKTNQPVVRQTRASRCGAVWAGRWCKHFETRSNDGQYVRAPPLRDTDLIATPSSRVELQTPEQQKRQNLQKQVEQEAERAFNARTLHVRRIPLGMFEEDAAIVELFSPYGQVVNVSTREQSCESGQRVSWALVTMCDTAALDNVLEHRPIFAGDAELGVAKVKGPKQTDDVKNQARFAGGAFAEVYAKAAQRVAAWDEQQRDSGTVHAEQGNSSALAAKMSPTRPNTAPPTRSTSPLRTQNQSGQEKFAKRSGNHSASRRNRQQGSFTGRDIASNTLRSMRPVSAPASPKRSTSHVVRPTSSSSSTSSLLPAYGSSVRRRSPSSAGPARMREARRSVSSSSRGGE